MNKLLFLLLLLSISKIYAQDSPYKSYKLADGQLLYEQVYTCDTMKSDQIGKMLSTEVPKIKGLTDFRKESEVITGRLKNAMIDYRKYGGKWSNTPVLLKNPFDANVTIEWKDGKYRVTLSNIIFHSAGFGETDLGQMLTRKKGTDWDLRPGAKQIGDYTEQYYTNLFWVKNNSNW